MSPAPLVLTLPLPPNLANGRMHWRVKDRKRRKYLALCDAWQACGMVPPPPRTPFPRATVAAAYALWNPMDDDNAMARAKWSLDWLVTRGYVAGDSRKHLTWAGVPSQRIERRTQSSVITLTLTPQE